MSVSREVTRFIGWINLKWYVWYLETIWDFEVGGGGWGKLNVPLEKSWLYIPLLVNIAIQMVCLWPVGILNLVGHNEKYWLTTNIIVSTYKVTFFTFYYYYFFYHNPFTPKPHCADSCPLYCLRGHQFKIHGQLFYHCWWSSACPPLCHSVQFTSSLSSHC